MRAILVVFVCASGALAQTLPPIWAPLPSATPSPAGRYLHGMTYDTARSRAVVFGGRTSYLTDTNSAETWEWDGASWLLRTTATAPSARRSFGFAFDSGRGVSVLFGGYASAATPQLADTWEWNGATWTQRTTGTAPPARSAHAMVYDAARQKVLLSGGLGAGGALNDTWEWDGTAWAQLSPAASPSPRLGHAMAYDPIRQRVVLFGGLSSATSGTALGDLWEWDGSNWLAALQPPQAPRPSPRHDAMLAYDASRDRCVLFGGFVNGTDFDDTWDWNGATWTQLSGGGGGTGFRRQARGVFDPQQQRVILFGGFQPCCFIGNDVFGLLNAAAIEYGVGCGATPLRLERATGSRPRIGLVAFASMPNAPTPVGGMAMGFSKSMYGPFQLPVPLDSVGMTGCQLWQSSEILGLGVSALPGSTSLVFAYFIPNSTSLIGGSVFLQGYCFAPGSNPLQIIASNGLEWRLGAF